MARGGHTSAVSRCVAAPLGPLMCTPASLFRRSREEVKEVYDAPLLELVFAAARVHRMYHDPRQARAPPQRRESRQAPRRRLACSAGVRAWPALARGAALTQPRRGPQVQQCTLMSIKTGGCPEDCGYCSQSSKHKATTGLKATKLADLDDVFEAAVRAKAAGSTRFCMGAAWRGPSQVGAGQFDRVLEMTRRIRGLGMEVCATLGMLNGEQAVALREAGLTAYNHNLDTSREHYSKVSTTRTYEDRLATLAKVRDAGISVCCGGILGLGEEEADRVGLLHTLATLPAHPESVPINALVAVKGTPLQEQPPVSALDLARAIAAARVVMPRSVVRLSAGRVTFSAADQALCFLAGANSVFAGDTLLTTPNNDAADDAAMFAQLGLTGRPAFVPYAAGGPSSAAFTAADAAAAARPAPAPKAGGSCGSGGGGDKARACC